VKGELVTDKVSLSIEDVPPGTYEMAVGAYNSENGKRLSVHDLEGTETRSNALVLEEVVIQ
jgi:hypothetical protein